MGLSSALATAMSGLRANQAALSIVSGNVANAQTPGYVTQTANQVELGSGGAGTGVQVTGVNRQLDLFVQSQLRTETSGGAYADQTANILGQLQNVYGTPGGAGTLETAFSNLTSALQALSTSRAASRRNRRRCPRRRSLAQQLNTTTQGIQSLRTNVNQDIGTSVSQANTAMTQIAAINTRLQGLSPTDPAAATLEDQRDNAINTLSKLMDVRAVTDSANQVTSSPIPAFSSSAAASRRDVLQFPGSADGEFAVQHRSHQIGVGSLTIQLPNGATLRHGRDQCLQFGTDRGRPQIARSDAGAGPDPGRSARRVDFELALRSDDGRYRRRRAAGRLQRRYVERVAGQHDQPDLYQQCDQHPAADIHRQCGRSHRCCRCRTRRTPIPADRGRFIRRHVVGRIAIECGAGRQRPAVFQSFRAPP